MSGKTCKLCGERGLHWAQSSSDDWRLHDRLDIPHTCSTPMAHDPDYLSDLPAALLDRSEASR